MQNVRPDREVALRSSKWKGISLGEEGGGQERKGNKNLHFLAISSSSSREKLAFLNSSTISSSMAFSFLSLARVFLSCPLFKSSRKMAGILISMPSPLIH